MRRIKIRWSPLLLCFALMSAFAYAQPSTVTLTATQDSYIDSRLSSGNYGSDSTMNSATYWDHGIYYYQRSFVGFDLSSIPSDAVIYSATLKLTRSTSVTGSATWKTKLIKSHWGEDTIKASLQPTISTFSKDIVSSNPSGISYVDEIDVKSMVQRLVYGQVYNYGWSVQLANEAYSGVSGSTFYTSESAVAGRRPKLVVEYYVPLSISDVQIVHESDTSAADASIAFTINGGASSSYTYSWVDASGVISSDSILDSIGYGWYGVHITGDYDEDFYQAFLVGRHCSEVTIDIDSSSRFIENAMLYGLVSASDGPNNNYANYTTVRGDKWTNGGTWYEIKSIFRPRIWVDDKCLLTQADMTLYGSAHSTMGGSNASSMLLVTENWAESLVTWNTAPTTSSSIIENIAATTTTTQNNTVDLKDFFDYWKEDNAQNFGIVLQLQSTSNYYHRQVYHAPSATTPSYRPDLQFTLDLLTGLEAFCNQPYIKLERKLTGLKYKSKYGKIYFAYDNEYASASSNLSYSIFSVENRISPVISSGTSALSLVYGYNNIELIVSSLTTGEIYILEVTNDRGEKWFLRFEKD